MKQAHLISWPFMSNRKLKRQLRYSIFSKIECTRLYYYFLLESVRSVREDRFIWIFSAATLRIPYMTLIQFYLKNILTIRHSRCRITNTPTDRNTSNTPMPFITTEKHFRLEYYPTANTTFVTHMHSKTPLHVAFSTYLMYV